MTLLQEIEQAKTIFVETTGRQPNAIQMPPCVYTDVLAEVARMAPESAARCGVVVDKIAGLEIRLRQISPLRFTLVSDEPKDNR
jgi:hypothetical protein